MVNTESDFVVRSVETGLGRLMLLVAVVSVDAYHFLAFSGLTCHLENTGIIAFCSLVHFVLFFFAAR